MFANFAKNNDYSVSFGHNFLNMKAKILKILGLLNKTIENIYAKFQGSKINIKRSPSSQL